MSELPWPLQADHIPSAMHGIFGDVPEAKPKHRTGGPDPKPASMYPRPQAPGQQGQRPHCMRGLLMKEVPRPVVIAKFWVTATVFAFVKA